MPWWITVYLAAFVIVFVSGFFYPSIGGQLGVYVLPMLVAGVIHELCAAKRTMDEKSDDLELSEKESLYLNNIGLLIGNLFIAPGYVFGLTVGLRNVG